MTASYLALFRRAPARRLIYALSAAALSFGMVALTVLLVDEHSTGSYRDGGFAVAAFSLMAGVSAPFRGRFVDRRGAHRALPTLATGYCSGLIALDVVAHAAGPPWLLVVLGGVIGGSTPPVFASGRAVWPQAVEPELLRHGYAATSLLLDIGQVAGPAIASLLFIASGWVAPVLCGATGIAAALLSIPTRNPKTYTHDPRPMPNLFRSRALAGLLAVSIVLGGSQGLVQVSVPAAAGRWHDGSLAGPLLAAFAVGSVLGALWFGSRSWHAPVIDRYLRCVMLLGMLLVPVAFAHGPGSLAPLLLLAGLAFGPATISLFETLDAVAPGAGAEALTWVTTAEAAGAAAGSALAGLLVSRTGIAVPFGLASAILVVPVGLMLGGRMSAVRRSRD